MAPRRRKNSQFNEKVQRREAVFCEQCSSAALPVGWRSSETLSHPWLAATAAYLELISRQMAMPAAAVIVKWNGGLKKLLAQHSVSCALSDEVVDREDLAPAHHWDNAEGGRKGAMSIISWFQEKLNWKVNSDVCALLQCKNYLTALLNASILATVFSNL